MSEELEKIFTSLVTSSWKIYNETVQNTHMDDLLVGAVITSNVESGYSLIDINSDGVHHYLRFEHLPTKQRIIYELTNLSENLVNAKVLGRRARVVIGYGQMVNNAGALWQALKAEFKSGFLDPAEPGVITCDADLQSGYIYVQVPLLINLDQYFSDGYQVNYNLLQQHISATIHSLAKYLQGRLSA
jgi:hypothetical protein